LQDEGGTLDHLPPMALIAGSADPLLPVAQCGAELAPAILQKIGWRRPLMRPALGENERDFVPFLEKKPASDAAAFPAPFARRQKVHAARVAGETESVGCTPDVRGLARIVECGSAVPVDLERSPDASDESNDLMIFVFFSVRRRMNRHEVDDFT